MNAETTRRETTFAELAARAGQDLGVSSWIVVDQARIDAFAAVTGDDGFIHVDPEKAAKTRFGGTIAHGLLTLSLMAQMGKDVLPTISDRAFLLNYGYDKIRLLSPVPSGASVRGRYRLLEASARSAKEQLLRFEITIESSASERPALFAEWLLMVVLK